MGNTVTRRPGTAPPGIHLWLLLWKATGAVEAVARRSIEATGLCLSDFAILEALLHKGPLPVGAFRSTILISSGSLTIAVDRLEGAGLVERRPAADDRRSRIVHLTTSGAVLIRQHFGQHARDLESAFGCLDGAERQALATLLRKLGKSALDPGASTG